MGFLPSRKNSYEALPTSETGPLVIGLDEQQIKARRRQRRRRCCHFLFALIALIFVGHGVFAYMYTRSHVECVPYEGPNTYVELPIYWPRSAAFFDSSVSSHDVAITRVETESNKIGVTIIEKAETPEDSEDLEEASNIKLCTLKGGKWQEKKHDSAALPIIKSLKIEIPTSIPPPSINLLPPKRGCHAKVVKLMKWAGVWN
ncbi:hypothetical protein FRC09_005130 [Ceratobasidium sp. 395]|nr:hypothetical protein FRC09_005130 [Ceratobasidium sp. 395]